MLFWFIKNVLVASDAFLLGVFVGTKIKIPVFWPEPNEMIGTETLPESLRTQTETGTNVFFF